MCTHALLPGVNSVMLLKICFLLRLNYRREAVFIHGYRTGLRPFSDCDATDTSEVISQMQIDAFVLQLNIIHRHTYIFPNGLNL